MNLTKAGTQRDRGAGRVELTVMLGLIGVLASAVLVVNGAKASADDAACDAAGRALITASTAYLGVEGTPTIADAGGPEGYERTLVEAGLLTATSPLYDIDAAGALVDNGSGCRLS